MNLKVGDKFRFLNDKECLEKNLPPMGFEGTMVFTVTEIFSDRHYAHIAKISSSFGIEYELLFIELPYVVLLTPKTNYGRKKYELVFRRS